jgi:uncharacterized protein YndB with AHSA1/START domain
MLDDRPSLTLVRHYPAPVERVWSAWTDPQKLTRWFGPDQGPVESAEVDVRPGGRFRIAFRTEDGERHVCLGEYREVVPNERLAFSWEWITMPERRSQVDLGFREVDGGTELTLHHGQFFDEPARDGHREGWSGALDKLGRLLAMEGGTSA